MCIESMNRIVVIFCVLGVSMAYFRFPEEYSECRTVVGGEICFVGNSFTVESNCMGGASSPLEQNCEYSIIGNIRFKIMESLANEFVQLENLVISVEKLGCLNAGFKNNRVVLDCYEWSTDWAVVVKERIDYLSQSIDGVSQVNDKYVDGVSQVNHPTQETLLHVVIFKNEQHPTTCTRTNRGLPEKFRVRIELIDDTLIARIDVCLHDFEFGIWGVSNHSIGELSHRMYPGVVWLIRIVFVVLVIIVAVVISALVGLCCKIIIISCRTMNDNEIVQKYLENCSPCSIRSGICEGVCASLWFCPFYVCYLAPGYIFAYLNLGIFYLSVEMIRVSPYIPVNPHGDLVTFMLVGTVIELILIHVIPLLVIVLFYTVIHFVRTWKKGTKKQRKNGGGGTSRSSKEQETEDIDLENREPSSKEQETEDIDLENREPDPLFTHLEDHELESMYTEGWLSPCNLVLSRTKCEMMMEIPFDEILEFKIEKQIGQRVLYTVVTTENKEQRVLFPVRDNHFERRIGEKLEELTSSIRATKIPTNLVKNTRKNPNTLTKE